MRRTYVGVGLVTLATLLLELILTRVFSVTLSYHFAFMVISLALFGLGLSGVVLYLKPDHYPEAELSALLASQSRRFALTLVLALVYIVNHTLTSPTDVLVVSRFTWQTFFELSFLYCIAALPFFYGGMVVSLALFYLRRNVSTLYFYDLMGASLACLMLDPLLRMLGAPNAVLLVGIIASAAAVLFGSDLKSWKPQRSSIYMMVAMVLILALNLGVGMIRVGDVKEVHQKLLVYSKWNAYSRIEVQKVNGHNPILTIDSQARTDIFSLKKMKEFAKQHHIGALAHVIRKHGKVLIIGPGGGIDVMSAIQHGHKKIVLAEINPIIIKDVMLGRFKEYSGFLYSQPQISVNLAEGRHFVRRSKERFDIIQATLVDTWAATAAGAFALTENNLYTVEAFEDYIGHLSQHGVVSMSRWVGLLGMEFVRLCALARTALERSGASNPAGHVFAASKENLGTLLVKRTPFTDAELHALHEAVAKRKFSIIYSPRTMTYNPASIVLSSKKVGEFYKQFPIDVRPVFDERPFFFYFVKPSMLWISLFGQGPMELNSSGTVILVALLGLVTALVLIGIVVPLWLGNRRALAGRTISKLRDLCFFLCIGVGFILIEIALLYRFSLHLGHPTHSLQVVLFTLLLFSGLGSLLSGRFSGRSLILLLVVAGTGVTLIVGIYAWLLPPLLHQAIGWTFFSRVLISVVLIAPLALLMGIMLPTGIRLVTGRYEEIVPWAWGLNGAASVFGSVAAMVISIHIGFSTTLLAGGTLYMLALLSGVRNPSVEC